MKSIAVTRNRNRWKLAGGAVVGLGVLALGLMVPTSTPAQGNNTGVTVRVRVQTASGERLEWTLPRAPGSTLTGGGLLGDEPVEGWRCFPLRHPGTGPFEISCTNWIVGEGSRQARVSIPGECATPQLRTGMLNLFLRPDRDGNHSTPVATIGFRCSNATP